MDKALKEIIDPATIQDLRAAGFRVVRGDGPTPAMMKVLTGMIPDPYAQGSAPYYHHLWNRMMFANDTDKE